MITEENYEKWCDATVNLNLAMAELEAQREENYSWICNEIKEFFSEFEIEKVTITQDGSIINVKFKTRRVSLDFQNLAQLPFSAKIVNDEGVLCLRLYTDLVEVGKE